MPSSLIIFKASADLVQKRTHSGRQYLIAPVVALRQGVLNGALVLAEEYSKFVEAWNGIPLPLGHPQASDGAYLSCNTPELLAGCPGRFFNAHMDGDKLVGEMWIDIEQAKAIGGKALIAERRLENAEPIEVSSAYFADTDQVSGEWEGQQYDRIQRNFRPNHLAILLDEKGACSWEMGCGAPRVNQEIKKVEKNSMPPELIIIHNDMSLDEQMSKVYNAFNEQFCSSAPMPGQDQPYIREVFPDKVIVRYDGKLFSYPYTIDANSVITFVEPIEVEMVYQPVTAANAEQPPATGQETPPVANVTIPVADSSATTEPTGILAAIRNLLSGHRQEPDSPCVNCPQAEGTTQAPSANAEPPVITPPATLSADEQALVALVHEQGGIEAVRTNLQALRDAAASERAGLVATIATNTRAFTADDLAAMTTDQLKKLRDATSPADFSGRGGPRENSHSAEPLVEAPMPG